MQQQKTNQLCYYFKKGQCNFGSYCRNSHQIISAWLIRHAQSQFNFATQNCGHEFESQEAKQIYQLNQKYIDCGITQNGINQIKQIKFSQSVNNNIIFDAIFVSPLQRALISADLMINQLKVNCKNVIVVPFLTQVLSKVCDFSSPIEQKRKKYQNFYFDYFNSYTKQQVYRWQDALVDEQFRQLIDQQQIYGHRYLKALHKCFPEPLQQGINCSNRVKLAYQQIRRVCLLNNYQQIAIISHNRVLKYMSKITNSDNLKSFANCQLRQAKF